MKTSVVLILILFSFAALSCGNVGGASDGVPTGPAGNENVNVDSDGQSDADQSGDNPTDGAPTGENPTDNAPTDGGQTGENPTDNAPTDGGQTGENPTDNAPTDGGQTGENPTDNAPTDGAPTGENPTDNTPTDGGQTGENPTDNTPTDGGQTGENPTDNTPTDGGQTGENPTDNTPTDGGQTGENPTDNTPTDGGQTGENPTDENPNAPDELVEFAIERGDARNVPLSSILDEALRQLEESKKWQCELTLGMFGDGAARYDGESYRVTQPSSLSAMSILPGNGGSSLAIASFAAGSRFAAFGSVPTEHFKNARALTFKEPFMRLLEWLLTGDSAAGVARQTPTSLSFLAFPDAPYPRREEFISYLRDAAPTWKAIDCVGSATMTDCVAETDLLVIGSNTEGDAKANILAALDAMMAANKPIIYLHTDAWRGGELKDEIEAALGFAIPYSNYWGRDTVDYSGVSREPEDDEMSCYDRRLETLSVLLERLKKADFDIDWTDCENDTTCEEAGGMSEFYAGARLLKSIVEEFDRMALDPFKLRESYRLEKTLILLGDKYRERIDYPMTKGATDDTEFLSALFADHAILFSREINPAQPDLGDFSGPIPSDHPTVTRRYTETTRPVNFITSTGVYALPGRTVTITRKDTLQTRVRVQVNMLRDGTSHIFGDGYSRPAFLDGKAIPIGAGATVKITSPYGGIIFANIDADATPSEVELEFENVAEHPVYSGTGSEDAFEAALESTSLNWAEIKTPGLEIHSRLDLMLETVSALKRAGGVVALADRAWNYLYKGTFGLAGRIGGELRHSAAVSAFCARVGWDCADPVIHGMSYIQHGNLDRGRCGYGCSGNPYDAWWAFEPLGWGDAHEISHTLQRSRLKIYDEASIEVSNNIFPIYIWMRFNAEDPGDEKHGRALGFPSSYRLLQGALALQERADRIEAARKAIWVDGDNFQRLIFYWQLVMNNTDVAHLGDGGWDLFRLLYLGERLYSAALASEETWLAARDSLGFSEYTLSEARELANHNDFMLVAVSFITGRDHRLFFDAWGVTYSEKASAQIERLDLKEIAPLQYWVVPNGAAFSEPLQDPLALDGSSVWPGGGFPLRPEDVIRSSRQ